MVLQFEEESFWAEDFVIPIQQLNRLFVLSGLQRARHLPGQAPGCADQPFTMRCQKFMIDTRSIVKTFKLRCRSYFKQVAVTGVIFCKK